MARFTNLVSCWRENLAYEIGFKAPLFDRMVQFNGGAFYYDYIDKQSRVRILDPLFSLLEKLVNVP